MEGNSIAGRKRNDGIDFYQTPTWVIEKLLSVETFNVNILEPCSGAGAISKVLEEKGHIVESQDIRIDETVYGTKGVDFLLKHNSYYGECDIVTNPPFIYAQQIIEKSLSISTGKTAMLLKLSFLESKIRYNFFKNTPLKKIYVFCKRVTMHPEGIEKPKNSGTIAFAWYIWEKGYTGEPTIDWIL